MGGRPSLQAAQDVTPNPSRITSRAAIEADAGRWTLGPGRWVRWPLSLPISRNSSRAGGTAGTEAQGPAGGREEAGPHPVSGAQAETPTVETGQGREQLDLGWGVGAAPEVARATEIGTVAAAPREAQWTRPGGQQPSCSGSGNPLGWAGLGSGLWLSFSCSGSVR